MSLQSLSRLLERLKYVLPHDEPAVCAPHLTTPTCPRWLPDEDEMPVGVTLLVPDELISAFNDIIDHKTDFSHLDIQSEVGSASPPL